MFQPFHLRYERYKPEGYVTLAILLDNEFYIEIRFTQLRSQSSTRRLDH